MKNFTYLSIVTLATAGLVFASGCGKDDDDDGSGSTTGGMATGGRASGGYATTGGSATTGGTQTGGGGPETGGGGSNTGGVSNTGGSVSGGTGGVAETGGTAGTGGTPVTGGAGGAGGGSNLICVDYVDLFVPLTAANTSTDFEVDFGADSLDMSGTTITVTLRVVTTGNAGGLQFYVKNGDNQSYAAEYLGWNNLVDLSDWTTLTFDMSTLTPTNASFEPTEVRYFGVNVAAGDEWETGTPVWADTNVQIDSVTFSDGVADDIDGSSDGGFAINEYIDFVANSAVSTGEECTEPAGTGGAGGEPGVGGGAGETGMAGGAGEPAVGGGAGETGMAGGAGEPAVGGGAGETGMAGGAGETGMAGSAGTAGAG